MAKIGNAAFELDAFGEGPHVVPQDRRAQRLVVGAEQGRPVHLTGKPDAGQRGESLRRLAADRRDHGPDPFRPIIRVLLAPQRMRTRNLERRGSFGYDALPGVDEQRLDRRCANVEPEKGGLAAPIAHHTFPHR